MQQLDKILLNGMRFYGYHGVEEREREQGQWFLVDLEIQGEYILAAETDEIKDALDYSKVYKCVKEIIEGTPVNLLEHLAQMVAREVLSFPLAEKVKVRIKKPQVSLGGALEFSGVELVRRKHES